MSIFILPSGIDTDTLTSTGTTALTTLTITNPLAISSGGNGAATTSQNFSFIGPTSGSGAPSFRLLVAGDIPSLSGTYLPLAGGVMSGGMTIASVNNSLIMTGAQATGTSPNIGISLGTTTAGANAAPQYSPILEFLAGGYTGSTAQVVGLNLKLEPAQGSTIGVFATIGTRTTTGGSYADSLQFGTDTSGNPRWSSTGTTLNYYTSAGDGMMVTSGIVNLSIGAGTIVRIASTGMIPFNVGTSNNGTTGNYWGTTVSKVFTNFNTAIGTAQTVGTSIQNTTAAANNTQQYSPVLELQGQGWKTATTAGTETVSFGLQAVPVQGVSTPTGILNFMSNINTAGYSNIASFDNKGRLHTGINGTAQTSGNFAFAGWGSSASVSAISGTDSKMTYTITASGTGQTTSPTTTITYADGSWVTVPFARTNLVASNDTTLTGESLNADNTTATTDVITVVLLGTLGSQAPVAGKTYTFSTITLGI